MQKCNAKATLEEPQQQATVIGLPPKKINLISCESLTHVSDIKLIRTDTTLDLSQKAEKGMPSKSSRFAIYKLRPHDSFSYFRCGIFNPGNSDLPTCHRDADWFCLKLVMNILQEEFNSRGTLLEFPTKMRKYLL
ncbi:hypothetical protein DKX38_021898 [Salix brachista]|uniref:Uncharacterized protein n=1 Tax=Salix brachista TaxID=2182728 RepID=A0A5N5JYB4_9ROSI|nr:hypothetical protein DKX38_021898 [Salix brachista]